MNDHATSAILFGQQNLLPNHVTAFNAARPLTQAQIDAIFANNHPVAAVGAAGNIRAAILQDANASDAIFSSAGLTPAHVSGFFVAARGHLSQANITTILANANGAVKTNIFANAQALAAILGSNNLSPAQFYALFSPAPGNAAPTQAELLGAIAAMTDVQIVNFATGSAAGLTDGTKEVYLKAVLSNANLTPPAFAVLDTAPANRANLQTAVKGLDAAGIANLITQVGPVANIADAGSILHQDRRDLLKALLTNNNLSIAIPANVLPGLDVLNAAPVTAQVTALRKAIEGMTPDQSKEFISNSAALNANAFTLLNTNTQFVAHGVAAVFNFRDFRAQLHASLNAMDEAQLTRLLGGAGPNPFRDAIIADNDSLKKLITNPNINQAHFAIVSGVNAAAVNTILGALPVNEIATISTAAVRGLGVRVAGLLNQNTNDINLRRKLLSSVAGGAIDTRAPAVFCGRSYDTFDADDIKAVLKNDQLTVGDFGVFKTPARVTKLRTALEGIPAADLKIPDAVFNAFDQDDVKALLKNTLNAALFTKLHAAGNALAGTFRACLADITPAEFAAIPVANFANFDVHDFTALQPNAAVTGSLPYIKALGQLPVAVIDAGFPAGGRGTVSLETLTAILSNSHVAGDRALFETFNNNRDYPNALSAVGAAAITAMDPALITALTVDHIAALAKSPALFTAVVPAPVPAVVPAAHIANQIKILRNAQAGGIAAIAEQLKKFDVTAIAEALQNTLLTADDFNAIVENVHQDTLNKAIKDTNFTAVGVANVRAFSEATILAAVKSGQLVALLANQGITDAVIQSLRNNANAVEMATALTNCGNWDFLSKPNVVAALTRDEIKAMLKNKNLTLAAADLLKNSAEFGNAIENLDIDAFRAIPTAVFNGIIPQLNQAQVNSLFANPGLEKADVTRIFGKLSVGKITTAIATAKIDLFELDKVFTTANTLNSADKAKLLTASGVGAIAGLSIGAINTFDQACANAVMNNLTFNDQDILAFARNITTAGIVSNFTPARTNKFNDEHVLAIVNNSNINADDVNHLYLRKRPELLQALQKTGSINTHVVAPDFITTIRADVEVLKYVLANRTLTVANFDILAGAVGSLERAAMANALSNMTEDQIAGLIGNEAVYKKINTIPALKTALNKVRVPGQAVVDNQVLLAQGRNATAKSDVAAMVSSVGVVDPILLKLFASADTVVQEGGAADPVVYVSHKAIKDNTSKDLESLKRFGIEPVRTSLVADRTIRFKFDDMAALRTAIQGVRDVELVELEVKELYAGLQSVLEEAYKLDPKCKTAQTAYDKARKAFEAATVEYQNQASVVEAARTAWVANKTPTTIHAHATAKEKLESIRDKKLKPSEQGRDLTLAALEAAKGDVKPTISTVKAERMPDGKIRVTSADKSFVDIARANPSPQVAVTSVGGVGRAKTHEEVVMTFKDKAEFDKYKAKIKDIESRSAHAAAALGNLGEGLGIGLIKAADLKVEYAYEADRLVAATQFAAADVAHIPFRLTTPYISSTDMATHIAKLDARGVSYRMETGQEKTNLGQQRLVFEYVDEVEFRAKVASNGDNNRVVAPLESLPYGPGFNQTTANALRKAKLTTDTTASSATITIGLLPAAEATKFLTSFDSVLLEHGTINQVNNLAGETKITITFTGANVTEAVNRAADGVTAMMNGIADKRKETAVTLTSEIRTGGVASLVKAEVEYAVDPVTKEDKGFVLKVSDLSDIEAELLRVEFTRIPVEGVVTANKAAGTQKAEMVITFENEAKFNAFKDAVKGRTSLRDQIATLTTEGNGFSEAQVIQFKMSKLELDTADRYKLRIPAGGVFTLNDFSDKAPANISYQGDDIVIEFATNDLAAAQANLEVIVAYAKEKAGKVQSFREAARRFEDTHDEATARGEKGLIGIRVSRDSIVGTDKDCKVVFSDIASQDQLLSYLKASDLDRRSVLLDTANNTLTVSGKSGDPLDPTVAAINFFDSHNILSTLDSDRDNELAYNTSSFISALKNANIVNSATIELESDQILDRDIKSIFDDLKGTGLAAGVTMERLEPTVPGANGTIKLTFADKTQSMREFLKGISDAQVLSKNLEKVHPGRLRRNPLTKTYTDAVTFKDGKWHVNFKDGAVQVLSPDELKSYLTKPEKARGQAIAADRIVSEMAGTARTVGAGRRFLGVVEPSVASFVDPAFDGADIITTPENGVSIAIGFSTEKEAQAFIKRMGQFKDKRGFEIAPASAFDGPSESSEAVPGKKWQVQIPFNSVEDVKLFQEKLANSDKAQDNRTRRAAVVEQTRNGRIGRVMGAPAVGVAGLSAVVIPAIKIVTEPINFLAKHVGLFDPLAKVVSWFAKAVTEIAISGAETLGLGNSKGVSMLRDYSRDLTKANQDMPVKGYINTIPRAISNGILAVGAGIGYAVSVYPSRLAHAAGDVGFNVAKSAFSYAKKTAFSNPLFALGALVGAAAAAVVASPFRIVGVVSRSVSKLFRAGLELSSVKFVKDGLQSVEEATNDNRVKLSGDMLSVFKGRKISVVTKVGKDLGNLSSDQAEEVVKAEFDEFVVGRACTIRSTSSSTSISGIEGDEKLYRKALKSDITTESGTFRALIDNAGEVTVVKVRFGSSENDPVQLFDANGKASNPELVRDLSAAFAAQAKAEEAASKASGSPDAKAYSMKEFYEKFTENKNLAELVKVLGVKVSAKGADQEFELKDGGDTYKCVVNAKDGKFSYGKNGDEVRGVTLATDGVVDPFFDILNKTVAKATPTADQGTSAAGKDSSAVKGATRASDKPRASTFAPRSAAAVRGGGATSRLAASATRVHTGKAA